ncbi:hypothetical protein [Acinetobacter sp. ANC 4648]|uniref:hypothetical protein n=1 Tax=Acinetobacter sp. ANC 4648 TaxID=1977875 RepID=UPI000A33518B|nr:hypothetical protein [Acinetobacter sp. ANC 4648]OTG80059.1 hypothetical protein B9T27_13915 [Acinetobacter sp. ANC 4648]
MNNPCINIAISGIGSTTTEDLKIRLRHLLPHEIGINWTSIADQNLDCLFINEIFYDNENVQNIIKTKKIPYLKISKKNIHTEDLHLDTLYFPILDDQILQDWLKINLQFEDLDLATVDDSELNQYLLKNIEYFQTIHQQNNRKLHFYDQFGTIAIIDHNMHFAWLEPTRADFKTDLSISFEDASTADFIKVSRKRQYNLEDWLFNLIWNSPQLCPYPNEHGYFRIQFWPQPLTSDQKTILQLSACFTQGAEILAVAKKLDLPITTVQHFIMANLAIQNVEKISARDSKFGQDILENQEQSVLKSFFGKLKSKFGF